MLKLVNRPDGVETGEPMTLDTIWERARELGHIRVWTNQYTGSHHVELMCAIRGHKVEVKSQDHADIRDALIQAVEEAWQLGVRP